MTAAKHALAEGDFALAAQRLVYARDAEPRNAAVLRLLTTAFWQAGDYAAAARAVRDWIRLEGERPAPYRTAARIYEDMGSLSQALDAAAALDRARAGRRDGWERLGRLRMRRFDRARRAGRARARPRARAVSEEGLLDLALVANLHGRRRRRGLGLRAGDAARARTRPAAWSRLAHALARTDRTSECLAACERALALPTTPRCAGCASRCSPWRRASSESSAAA